MARDDMHPDHSPQMHTPPFAARRMNRLPIVFVGVLFVIVAGSLVYAAYERAQRNKNPDTKRSELQSLDSGLEGAERLLATYAPDESIVPERVVPETVQGPAEMAEEAQVNNVPDAIEDAPNRDGRNATTATPVLSMEAREEQARRARAMRFREDMFYDGVVSTTKVR
jgi:hypothetical protein